MPVNTVTLCVDGQRQQAWRESEENEFFQGDHKQELG